MQFWKQLKLPAMFGHACHRELVFTHRCPLQDLGRMKSWLLWALLAALQVRVSLCQDGFQPPVPQGVRVEPDFWLTGAVYHMGKGPHFSHTDLRR
ncbi:hypothetical protein SKAU_G00018540 [Synaphobranchus kaupii]|uniref:Uncharacterized protein n=1 Tax=Synaphobranchus kaupii TaxID=118154 RepID=A0A9Q1GBC8_SYNKA|nr:hypothetical protein SKAU_G00018540 [Synaphobranchus kaupii]